MFQPYTYYLYHTPTGKKYYGVRVAPKAEPENDLWTHYFSSSDKVRELIDEYGIGSFIPEIRKTFADGDSAIEWEQKVLLRLDVINKDDWINQAVYSGHFYFKGPRGPMSEDHKAKLSKARTGQKSSEATKAKISKSHLGVPKTPHTEETKEKLRQALLDRPRPEEVKKKIGSANKGKKLSQEQKDHLRNVFAGRTFSEETRLKMSESAKNRPQRTQSPETKEKIRAALKGRPGQPRSQETREKMSNAHKGKIVSEATREKMRNRVLSPETRAKISAARKLREANKHK